MPGFSDKVTGFVVKAHKELDKSFRKNVFQLWTDTVQGTPRITGTLRANWQIGINQTNSNKLSPGQRNADPSSLKITDVGIVYNNMEYAEVVENGLPGTARVPRKMLANAINAARSRKGLRR